MLFPANLMASRLVLRKQNQTFKKSSQSHLEKACRYPHLRECTFTLRVLAVACIMHNEALDEHYGALWNVTEKLQIVMGCYGMLQSIVGCYGSIIGCCEALWNNMEHCTMLQDVMERYRSVADHNGTIMENIDFAHH